MTTHTVTPLHSRFAGRVAYAMLAALLLTAIIIETITHGTGYWQIAAFGFAPNLPSLFAAGSSLEQGRFHPRAVGAYNFMHRFWGPVAIAAVAASGRLSVGFLIGALTWAFHLAADRVMGFGVRTPEGFLQRSRCLRATRGHRDAP